jgi:multidrug efflux system outer membrane protein
MTETSTYKTIQKTACFGLKVIAFTVLLNSCKVGPNYVRTSPALPEKYNYDFPADTTIVNTPWWELFGDTVLVGLIREGLENNKNMKMAIARMNEAGAAIGIARADLYPKINYGVGGSSTAATGSGFSHDYSGGVNVSYTIDIWGRVSRLEEAALMEYLATEEAYRGLNILLVSQIATAYLTLCDLDNRLFISEKTAETWQTNLEIVKARQKGGFVSEVDLNMAKIQLLEAQTAIQSFTRLRFQLENAICLLLGKTTETIPRGLALQSQVFVPEIPVGMPSELLDRRPDVLQAERSLQAQTERIGAAEALRYPSFTLSGDVGMTFVNPVTGFAALGAQLLGPLFNMNANKKRVEVEKARTEQLLYQYEFACLNALREVEDAMIAVKTYQKEFELRNEQMLASKNAVNLSWVRYEGGMTSYLEVLDLQRSSFNSQLKASETLQYQLVSIVQLYQALGGGWNP